MYHFQVIASYLSKVAYFNLLHLHLASQLGVAAFLCLPDLLYRKTRVPSLSCEIVCMILSLAVLIQHSQRVTETQDDGIYRTITASHDINIRNNDANEWLRV